MSALFPSWSSLAAFVVASLVLAVTPGPAVLYIVTRSVVHGRWSGLASVAGVAVGNFGNAIGAAIGLAALFAVSSLAYSVVKYAGALYLVYLGISALRAKPLATLQASRIEPEPVGTTFRDGLLVALFNPKTAIFFAAFLPQFLPHDGATAARSVALGALFVCIAAITDSVYALSASAVATRWRTRVGQLGKAGRFTSAGLFIGLGVFTAWGDSRAAK
jgi:threonine/homoserine/homoserine lactone efflux protein